MYGRIGSALSLIKQGVEILRDPQYNVSEADASQLPVDMIEQVFRDLHTQAIKVGS